MHIVKCWKYHAYLTCARIISHLHYYNKAQAHKYTHKYIHHIDLLSLLGLLDFLNLDIPYRLKKLYHPCRGDPQWAKIKKNFFSIFGIRMTQFAEKSKKKFSNFLTQKNSIPPRWGDPQWAKIKKKFFFSFLASE